MAIKNVIHRNCPKCGALQLRDDDIYQPCNKCAPPGPLSPPRRISKAEVIIVEPTDLPAAVEEIKRLQSEIKALSVDAAKSNPAEATATPFEHPRIHDMAELIVNVEALTLENSILRQDNQKLITEVHGKYGMRHLTDQLLTLTADRDTLRQQLAEANYKLFHSEAALQQANAASGEDTKRLDWLQHNAIAVTESTDLRAAIDQAMEGSRT